jgi:hypothetical protein
MTTPTSSSITTVTVWQYEPETTSPEENEAKHGEELYIPALRTIFTSNGEFIRDTDARNKKGYELQPTTLKASHANLFDYSINDRGNIQNKSIDLELAARIELLFDKQTQIQEEENTFKTWITKKKFTERAESSQINALFIHADEPISTEQFHSKKPYVQKKKDTIYLPKLKVSIDQDGQVKFADKKPQFPFMETTEEKVHLTDEKLKKIMEFIELNQEYHTEKNKLINNLHELRNAGVQH